MTRSLRVPQRLRSSSGRQRFAVERPSLVFMLRRPILAAARSPRLKRIVSTAPVSRDVVRRFVAGETTEDAVRVTRELADSGLTVSLDHLGEDTLDLGQAEAATKAYLSLLTRLGDEGLAPAAEVSVKLTALGQLLDERIAFEHVRTICSAAADVGTTVTLDMEDHTTTDSTLRVLGQLRVDFPGTAAVIQSYLHRSEDDCRALTVAGSRVRLCKGAYDEPPEVAYQDTDDVDRSY